MKKALRRLCRLVLSLTWAVLRKIEPSTEDPAPAPKAKPRRSLSISRGTLGLDILLAQTLMDGPLIATLVDLDGVIRVQRGGSLARHDLSQSGWAGRALPGDSLMRDVLCAVIENQRPRRYYVEWEGIPYEGIAFPWLGALGETLGVVFFSIDLSMVDVQAEEKILQQEASA